MKRLTFLLALSAFLVGCTSRIPAGFQPLSSGNGGSGFSGETLDTRPTGYDAMANAIRNGNIPPDAVAARVKGTKVIIAGYTDTFGTEEYNLGLSDRRAQSVRDYLVGLGANQANSEIMALGSQQADKSAAGRQSGAKDRKAIVVDVNYGGAATASRPASRPAAAPAPAAGAAPAPVSAL